MPQRRKALCKKKPRYFVAAVAFGTESYLLLGSGKPLASLAEARKLAAGLARGTRPLVLVAMQPVRSKAS